MDYLHAKRALLTMVLVVCNKLAVTDTNETTTRKVEKVFKCTMGLSDRVPCGAHGTSGVTCSSRGCCYDPVYNMCYFPAGCSVLTSVVGGGSFYYVLPGRDNPRGRMALPSGRGWCTRDLHSAFEEISLEMTLKKSFSIIFLADHQVHETFVFPFLLSYRNVSGKFAQVHVQPPRIGKGQKSVFETVEGDAIRIKPLHGNPGSCTHLTVFTCPYTQPTTLKPPTTTPTEDVTTANQVTTETSNLTTETAEVIPTPRVEEVSQYFTTADKRPSAIFIGTFGILIFTSLIAVFLLLDIPTYKKNFTYMRRNIKHLQVNIKRRRRKGYKPARMSDMNCTPCTTPKRNEKDITQTSLCISDS